MRGQQNDQEQLFYSFRVEDRIPANHPLRTIKHVAKKALKQLEPLFNEIYSDVGRPSIPPERLLLSKILMMLYTIRSERMFCEQLDYNMLFRWFLDMNPEEESFNHSTFSKNCERLIEHDVAMHFFYAVVDQARRAGFLSGEHFSVDGTLLEAWASHKSFKPKVDDSSKKPPASTGRNTEVDFKGEKRVNETHQSSSDPDARLFRKSKGTGAILCYLGNAVIENRNGLCVEGLVKRAAETRESDAAIEMLRRMRRKTKIKTLGADKGYCNRNFVKNLRRLNIRPHVAKIESWNIPGLDKRTTQGIGYRLSQRVRKRIEEVFGWLKTVAGLRKVKQRGIEKVSGLLMMGLAAFNLRRMATLMA